MPGDVDPACLKSRSTVQILGRIDELNFRGQSLTVPFLTGDNNKHLFREEPKKTAICVGKVEEAATVPVSASQSTSACQAGI